MSRESSYYIQYIGPVFLINKTESNKYDIEKNIFHSCSNINCEKYLSEDLRLFNFCPYCSNKIKAFTYKVEVDMKPNYIDDEIFNNLFNPFNDDNNIFYIPFQSHENLSYGILSYEEYSKKCTNEICGEYECSLNIDFKFCPECGKEIELIKHNHSYGNISNKDNDIILEKYEIKGNKTGFHLINDYLFEKLLKNFNEDEKYINYKKTLEMTYGKNSVFTKIASIKYKENF